MSDPDSDFVLKALLECVEVQQQQGNWAYICVKGTMMIQDIDFMTGMSIAGRELMYNMYSFFPGLLRRT